MFSKALLILSLISVAFATVYVTEPVATTSFAGGMPGVVSWQDGGDTPSLTDFGVASISIYAGNAQQQTNLKVLNPNIDVSTASSINFTVDPTTGPNSSHYFIRFQSLNGKNADGTPFESFSAQFTLTNMTGTFSAAVQSEIEGLSTAPLGVPSSTSSNPTPTPTPSMTTSIIATRSSSTTSATAKTTSGAMGIKAGWAGLVFGAVVGVTLF